MRIFFSRSPMVCLCLYVWAFYSYTDTWTTVSFSQFVFVDRTSNIWEFTSQSGGIFFFLMGTDKYDPVEMSTIKRTDEIKQCSRAQRITHQNKIYMRKWNLLLVGFSKWWVVCFLPLDSFFNSIERGGFLVFPTNWYFFVFNESFEQRDIDLDEVV